MSIIISPIESLFVSLIKNQKSNAMAFATSPIWHGEASLQQESPPEFVQFKLISNLNYMCHKIRNLSCHNNIWIWSPEQAVTKSCLELSGCGKNRKWKRWMRKRKNTNMILRLHLILRWFFWEKCLLTWIGWNNWIRNWQ